MRRKFPKGKKIGWDGIKKKRRSKNWIINPN